jgi:hypothetical protein
MNLYSKVVPTGRLIVAVHSGLDDVYELADKAIADEVDQEPNWLMDPVMKTFSPYVVVTSSLKVTEIVVAAVHVAEAVVVLDVLVLFVVVKVVEIELAELVEEVLELELEVDPDPDPDPDIAISAQ